MLSDIEYAIDGPPQIGEPIRVAENLYMLRLPLPFALDHVNVWLLEGDSSWTIIDTGMGTMQSLGIWEKLLVSFLKNKPVEKLILTHYHPDHVGLSGDLVARTGAAVYMSRVEWLTANMLFHDAEGKLNTAMLRLFQQHGLPDDQYQQMSKTRNIFAARCFNLPLFYRRLQHGELIEMAGSNWQCRVGKGHSPEHIALYCRDRKILIAGDHILPKITPNIPMPVQEPFANPVADYLESLSTFSDMANDVLVLPSHRLPFRGIRIRIDQLISHHHQRLERLYEACDKPVSVYNMLPVLFNRALDLNQMTFAMLEGLSHMVYLEREGNLIKSEENSVYVYQHR